MCFGFFWNSIWKQKGATLSDKSARQEFGLTQQEMIEAGRMFRGGHKFYRFENGVWLTDSVPPSYLRE